MRKILRALWIAAFAVIAFIVVHQNASAEITMVITPPDMTDIQAGQSYVVTVTVSSDPDDVAANGTGWVTFMDTSIPYPATSLIPGTSVSHNFTFVAPNRSVTNCASDGGNSISPFLQFAEATPPGYHLITFSDSVWVPCSLPVLTPVSVVPPTRTVICGDGNDVIHFPQQLTGVVLGSDSGWDPLSATRTIKYVAEPGYELTGDSSFVFHEGGRCLVWIHPPNLQEVCGPDNDSIGDIHEGEGVTMQDSGWSNGTRTISYEADEFHLITSTPTTYTFVDENRPCLNRVNVVPPTQTEVCGPNNDPINFPDQPEGIVLGANAGWGNNSRTIRYTALEGYEIQNAAEYVFTDNNASSDCVTLVRAVPPEQVAICGDVNDEVTPGVQPEGIITVNEDEWSSNVRVFEYALAPGYITDSELRFIIQDEGPCAATVFPPQYRQQCGPNNDQVEIVGEDLQEHVQFVSDTGWQDGTRTITYEANYNYEIVGRSVFTYIDENRPCQTVSPVPPIHLAYCGYQNDKVLVPPQPEGVSWYNPGWVNGVWELSFTPSGGATFTPGTQREYTFTQDDRPCGEVVPIAPVHDAICGPANDVVTIPAQPGGVTISVDSGWDNGEYRIAFAPLDGDTFPADTQTEYTFTEDVSPCSDEVTPIPPIQTDVCGENNDIIDIPRQPDGVLIAADTGWSDGKYVVAFEPAEGITFPTDFQTEYRFVEADTPCTEVIPVPPAEIIRCGPDNDGFDLPEQPEGVDWDVEYGEDPETATISFFPMPGYVFPDGTQTVYLFEFENDENTPCPEEASPLPPVHAEVCGPNNDEITIPDQPEGVVVDQSDSWTEGTYTVTFEPAEGVTFPEGAQATYTFVDENTNCGPGNLRVTVTVRASAGAPVTGAPWKLYAPIASQVALPPFAEGTVGADSTFELTGLLPGEYRLVISIEGYRQLNETISITPETTELFIEFEALQVPPTAEPGSTPTPTPTVEPGSTPTPTPTAEPGSTPTPSPTVEPEATSTSTVPSTAPTQTPPSETPTDSVPTAEADSPVTGLPSTGSGPDGDTLAIGGLLTLLLGLFALARFRKVTDNTAV